LLPEAEFYQSWLRQLPDVVQSSDVAAYRDAARLINRQAISMSRASLRRNLWHHLRRRH
jgi:hypothetical protein